MDLERLSGLRGDWGRPADTKAPDFSLSEDATTEFENALQALSANDPSGVGDSSLLHRLTPERARLVIRTFGVPAVSRETRTPPPPKRTAPQRRARSPLAPNGPSNDPAVERPEPGSTPTAEELEGAGHMEMHWSAEDVGLSTFVGGSQAAEAAHCTAFGRDIGAEVGLQFLDSESRAFRVMVARSFQNDLDVPVQEAKFQFEVNVRF